MPFYDSWMPALPPDLGDAVHAAWVRGDRAAVTRELVSAAVARQDADLLAMAVEADARTLETSNLRRHVAQIEAFPPSPVKDAALALITLRLDVGDRNVLPARAAIGALNVSRPALAASVAVRVAFLLSDRARWAEAGWFVEQARTAVARPDASAYGAASSEALWFGMMAVATLVEWHTYTGTAAFDELNTALLVPRSRNLLQAHHAAALLAVGQVQAGDGHLGAAAADLAHGVRLLRRAPSARGAASALLAMVQYRLGEWGAARRSAAIVARTASEERAWLRAVSAALSALDASLRGDTALASQWIEVAGRVPAEGATVLATTTLLQARIVRALGSDDPGSLIRLLDATRGLGHRLPYSPHEWRMLRGIGLRRAGQREKYGLLVREWSREPGAGESAFWWSHAALLAHETGDPSAVRAARRALSHLAVEDDRLAQEWVRLAVGMVLIPTEPAEASAVFDAAHAALVDLGAAGFAASALRAKTASMTMPVRSDALTPQQQRIAELVAEGYTSSEIGALLFLSKKTIDFHVAKILARLGLSHRRELLRWATRRSP